MRASDFLQLTEEEFDTVLEALDHYKHKDFGSHVMKSMLKSMISDRVSPEAKIKMEKEEELEEKKEELEKLQIKRKVDYIKAKLILINAERGETGEPQ